MLSLGQAAKKRGEAGKPLPNMWPKLAEREAFINRGQVTLVVGPPSAGKSLLTMNYIVRAKVPTMAFLLDTDQLTAAARFAAIETGNYFSEVKANIDGYADALSRIDHVQTVFHAESLETIRLQVEAFEARYGSYPSMILIDNLGNLTSAMADEWAILKALTLELDGLAKEWQTAIVATHHSTDLTSCEPAQRTSILGKVAQYPRLIYSVNFNPQTQEYKVAIVKNSQGPSDPAAQNPVVMYADTAKMALYETNPNWTPSAQAVSVSRFDRWGALKDA